MHAAPQTFTSGSHRTHLLELFSSEGCSSCPPAEAAVGGLRDAPGLWRDFVPVSWHVTYWDKLGWRDRFASRVYTERQYRYASDWGSGNVYTPCFVFDGQDAGARLGAEMSRVTAESAGILAATLRDDGKVEVSFTSAAARDCVVTVAVLGGGIVSPVRAGENGGRTLRHEFVVLGATEAPLREGRATVPLAKVDASGVTRRALAVWVAPRGAQTPLQATGGWLAEAGASAAQ
ncbi:MAG: DUF1223 domain-containing protein [Candidatus Didemnitutus sp.]|nr:DUF1223 domain-containing protein [Candidatus Didemnitutus sp.]